jgi:putative DNA-invertase from lambdoid prophage Rac
MNVGLYTRVSTNDQHTLPMQMEALKQYVERRQWHIVLTVEDIASGSSQRPQRERILKAARQREIDTILVWRLDRWGRSVPDLVSTLHELNQLGIGFISITEALDLTTATGRAMAGLLAVFAEFERDLLRERVKAGIAHSKKMGKSHGRPSTANRHKSQALALFQQGMSKSKIAKELNISRTSARRLLSLS